MEKEKTNTAKPLKKVESFINTNLNSLLLIILSLILIVSIFSFMLGFGARSTLNQKIEEARILAIPVSIQLKVINCNGCADIKEIISSIKKQNVNITSEQVFGFYDLEVKQLISDYEIKTLPTILILGEISSNKIKFDNFEKVNDALVLKQQLAPYLDIITNNLKGIVDIIEVVDSSCKNCIGLSSIPSTLSKSGVSIGDWKKIEYTSAEGAAAIKKYSLTHVPTVLISKEINYYDNIKQTLTQAGASNKGDYYSLHSKSPPYRNITSNKIVGLVDLILIYDKICSNCYDVNLNKAALKNLGIFINTEKTYDISYSEAKSLIAKYSIEKIPTMILSPEANSYPGFANVWRQVGTIENDEWFVMRKPEVLGNVTGIKK